MHIFCCTEEIQSNVNDAMDVCCETPVQILLHPVLCEPFFMRERVKIGQLPVSMVSIAAPLK